MAKNIGTLVTAAIRPNDDRDLISSAFANEIKGGLHSVTSSTDRDDIMTVRREWGMLCSVNNENKTYKLVYGLNSTDIDDDANWDEFQGGSGGGGEWVNSVLSIRSDEPIDPSDGDRYLVGSSSTYSITGDNWEDYVGGVIAQWNESSERWIYTIPLEGMSTRVDDQYNYIYSYQGTYSSGTWYKDKENQVRYIYATSSNGKDYVASSLPLFDVYDPEMIYIVKFATSNTGNTVSLSINDEDPIIVKKSSGLSLLDILADELTNNYQYVTTYNGTCFELRESLISSTSLTNKYYIAPNETITVPPYTQYFIYSDLTIDGTLNNMGETIIVNGDLIVGTDSIITGPIQEISFAQIDGRGESYYLPRWKDKYFLTPTSSIYDSGDFVSISCPTFSVVNDFVLPKGASQGYVLTSDSNGLAAWEKSVMKYTVTQSFIANTTYSISHNLDSKSIVYNLWNEETGDSIIPSIRITDLNTVELIVTQDIDNARVVIIS